MKRNAFTYLGRILAQVAACGALIVALPVAATVALTQAPTVFYPPGATFTVDYSYVNNSFDGSPAAYYCTTMSNGTYLPGGTFSVVQGGTLPTGCVNATAPTGITNYTLPPGMSGTFNEVFPITPAQHGQLVTLAGGLYSTVYYVREWSDLMMLAGTQLTVQPFILAPLILATPDIASLPLTGGSVDVLGNDTIGGLPATGNVTLTVTNPGGLSIAVSGANLVIAAAPASTYMVNYQICDTNPLGTTNCAPGAVAITLAAAVTVVANPDSVTVPYATGGTLAILTNDTVGGVAATSANAITSILAPGGLVGVSLNGVPQIVVPPNTVPALYNVTYQICAVVSPATCASAIAAITVSPPVLVGSADTAPVPFGGGTVSVLANDTVDGAAATSANVVVTILNPASLVGLTINGAGAIVFPSGTNPSGTYPVVYQICAIASPASCVPATATITIGLPVVTATADTLSIPNTGGTLNVLANDLVNAVAATSGNGIVTITNAGGLVGLTVNGAGAIVVPASAAGPYSVIYQLCAVLSPATCSTATASVTITIGALALVANADAVSVTVAGGTFNVMTNDLVAAVAATPVTATTTLLTNGGIAGLTLSAAGLLTVPATTTGVYNGTYQLCQATLPANCVVGNMAISVGVPPLALVANPDTATVPSGGGTINVLTNDLVGGVAATTITGTTALVSNGGLAGLTLSTSGALSIPPANAGTYSASYQLCQATLPANCVTGTISITVTASAVANADTATVPYTGGTVSVLANDRVGASAATATNGIVTIVNAGGITGLTVNAAMQLVVPANIAPNTYTVGYQLCVVSAPSVCATATVTLTIAPPSVAAVNDTLAIPDTGGTLNVIANDTIDGQMATLANSTVSIVSAGNLVNLTINANRAIVVPANRAGTYTITYRICSAALATACANANVALTLSVTARTLTVVDDYTAFSPRGGTLMLLGNDRLAGAAIVPADVVVTIVDNGGVVGASIAANGVAVIPALSPGAYTLTYRVCQANLPANCANARIFVNITTSLIGSSTVRRPPSSPGPIGIIAGGTGATPFLFSSALPSSAGQAGDTLILGETRLGYGLNSPGGVFQRYRSEDEAVPFGAQFYYSGSGSISYRWEVMQPGDPEPTDFDLLPQPGLSLEDQFRQYRYTEIDRGDVRLPPFGRYFLRGPDPAKLPRDIDGTYRVLLRIEADSSNPGGAFTGASPFPIRPLTYVVVAGRPPVSGLSLDPNSTERTVASATKLRRDKFTAKTGVAEFTSLGTLPDGGPVPDSGATKLRAIGQGWPTLLPAVLSTTGATTQADGNVQLAWNAFTDAGSYRVYVEAPTPQGVLATPFVVVVKAGGATQYNLTPATLAKRFAGGALRWRVSAHAADGKLVAQSKWNLLKP